MSGKSSSRRRIVATAPRKTAKQHIIPSPTTTSPHQQANQRKTSFFRRIDIRFPWLKLIAVVIVGSAMIMDLLDLTISGVYSPDLRIRTAPMSYHVRATERTLDGKKLIALTFDDGPSVETTPRLLDVLTEKDTPATFFMLGAMARNNPDIVKRIEKEHHGIGSHTTYHQNLVRLPKDAAVSDIKESITIFNDILGHGPTYTRPPYGNINDTVRDSVGTPIILWSVDPADWKNKDPKVIVETVKNQAHDGAVILMHDIYPSSVEAVPLLIDALRSDGYEFATIPEIAKIRNIQLATGVTYYNFLP